MDREVHIEQKLVDGQEALVVSLPGADDDELGEMFEKLAIIRSTLLPEAIVVEGVLIMRFLMEVRPTWEELLDADPRYLTEDGDLSISGGDKIALKDLGHYVNADGEDVTFLEVFGAWAEEKLVDPRRKSGRYPYTYAADLVKMFGPSEGVSPVLDRSTASQLYKAIGHALGISERVMAESLADYYLANEDELVQRAIDDASAAWEG